MSLPSILDYVSAIQNQSALLANEIAGAIPMEKSGRLIKYSGGFCVVFPCEINSRKYAVRCWHTDVDRSRIKKISETLSVTNLPYFVSFKYIEKAILTESGPMPIVLMDWVDALPLKKYIEKHISEKQTILKLAEAFKDMVASLHQHHISHGDLQHGNILVKADGSIILVDYDSLYVPSLQGEADEVKGLVGYQHPARWSNKYITEKADYFSELVIYLSIVAFAENPELFEELMVADSETLLFSKEDIDSKGSSAIFSRLLPHPTLGPMIKQLKDFLREKDICNLIPLEEAIIDKETRHIEKITKGIEDKWKMGNGYNPTKKEQGQIARITTSVVKKF